MKKVFHIVSTNIFSGAENVAVNISSLVTGYEHYYVCIDGPINAILEKRKIKHISIAKFNLSTIRRLIKKEKPDIVHAHDVKASILVALNARLIKSYGGKLISQLHNNDPRMKKLSLRLLTYSLVQKRFNQIVVVTPEIMHDYYFKKQLDDRWVAIPNIIDIEYLKNQVSINSHKYDLAFVGRMSDQKNPLSFVHLIANISKKLTRKISVVMVGSGELFEDVKGAIKKAGLIDQIELTGFVNNPASYIANSSILVMTSSYEGLPMVILEALALGTPVASLNVGGVDKILTSKTGFIAQNLDELEIFLIDNLKSNFREFNRAQIKDEGIKLNNAHKFVADFEAVYAN